MIKERGVKLQGQALLFAEDVAVLLGLTVGTVQSKRWQDKTKFPFRKHGKRLIALENEVLSWCREEK